MKRLKKTRVKVVRRTVDKGNSVKTGCAKVGISRQAYYKQHKVRMKKEIEREKILGFVKGVRMLHTQMGVRKVLLKLAEEPGVYEMSIGRDRFFDFLREEGLLIKVPQIKSDHDPIPTSFNEISQSV